MRKSAQACWPGCESYACSSVIKVCIFPSGHAIMQEYHEDNSTIVGVSLYTSTGATRALGPFSDVSICVCAWAHMCVDTPRV